MGTSLYRRKYEISETRKKAFEQRPGEDAYQWIARQLTMATPFEGAWLMMLRSDEKQRHVFELVQLAKSERAARRSMWALYMTLAVAIVAAFVK